MIIGLEIEGVINRSIIKFPIGNYHDGISLGRYWESQSDSSIRMDDKFKNEETVEIVSEIIKNKSEFKDAINELISFTEEIKYDFLLLLYIVALSILNWFLQFPNVISLVYKRNKNLLLFKVLSIVKSKNNFKL